MYRPLMIDAPTSSAIRAAKVSDTIVSVNTAGAPASSISSISSAISCAEGSLSVVPPGKTEPYDLKSVRDCEVLEAVVAGD